MAAAAVASGSTRWDCGCRSVTEGSRSVVGLAVLVLVVVVAVVAALSVAANAATTSAVTTTEASRRIQDEHSGSHNSSDLL